MNYSEPLLTIFNVMNLLDNRGISYDDKQKAEDTLRNMSLFRLKGIYIHLNKTMQPISLNQDYIWESSEAQWLWRRTASTYLAMATKDRGVT